MRTSGILLPISSLPSPYGIGCFSKEAYEFVDKLQEAQQTYWQILPLGPTGYGDSPYQPFSAFAGNPYFIDFDALEAEGLLKKSEYAELDFGDHPGYVSYDKQYQNKYTVLRKAFARFDQEDKDYQAFCKKEADWLEDYCLYMAMKNRQPEKSWNEWDEDLRLRKPQAMAQKRSELAEDIAFQKFMQYEFMKQWAKLKAYANEKDVKIIGDIPIYVAFDGADCWSNQEMFQFDEEHKPIAVAGCPPDAFSEDGQLWGNPLYDWGYHERSGFAWWIRRMERCFALYDVVRVDHFRGFDQYYSIPYGDPTARNGHWEDGPSLRLFDALKAHFGEMSIIAEDLGYLTDSVIAMVKGSGFPGMKVIEFAFDSREDSDYLPHNYTRNCVVYTGTHDNQTLSAWIDELAPEDRAMLEDYVDLEGKNREQSVWAIIRLTLASVADTAIIPMQDYLTLGAEARINQPATFGNNWKWRLQKDQFTSELAAKIKKMCLVYGRNRR